MLVECCGTVERGDLSLNLAALIDQRSAASGLILISLYHFDMKLTPELLAQAPSHLNAVKERQLDLRG